MRGLEKKLSFFPFFSVHHSLDIALQCCRVVDCRLNDNFKYQVTHKNASLSSCLSRCMNANRFCKLQWKGRILIFNFDARHNFLIFRVAHKNELKVKSLAFFAVRMISSKKKSISHKRNVTMVLKTRGYDVNFCAMQLWIEIFEKENLHRLTKVS